MNSSFVRAWKRSLKKYWQLYLLLIPVIAYYVIFKYVPMVGAQIAFRNFKFSKGIWGSPWVGLKHFERFFSNYSSTDIILNTFVLSGLSLVFCFPFPIIIALIFNEIRTAAFKKSIQTITYAPHFISTIVVVGMMMALCSPSTGVINKLLVALHLTDGPLYLMGESRYFRFMYIISDIWKDSGWNAIIFVSALAAIDISLYEAAKVDGASRWQQLIHITLPSILPTIIIMLILKCGHVLNIGFEKVYAMQTD